MAQMTRTEEFSGPNGVWTENSTTSLMALGKALGLETCTIKYKTGWFRTTVRISASGAEEAVASFFRSIHEKLSTIQKLMERE